MLAHHSRSLQAEYLRATAVLFGHFVQGEFVVGVEVDTEPRHGACGAGKIGFLVRWNDVEGNLHVVLAVAARHIEVLTIGIAAYS